MKITTQTHGFSLTPSMKEYVEEKMSAIGKLVSRLDSEGAVELRMELAKTTGHRKQGEIFEATGHLRLPKSVLKAEAEDADIHTAIDRVRDKLKHEFAKYKTKHLPKGAGTVRRGK